MRGNENYFRRFSLKLHKENDIELIAALDASGNYNGLVKEALAFYIEGFLKKENTGVDLRKEAY